MQPFSFPTIQQDTTSRDFKSPAYAIPPPGHLI
jgi:hypothetical protein